MGRDITGLRFDKIPNNVPKSNGINHVTVHVTPRIAAERVEETDSNAEDLIAKSLDDGNGLEKQDVLGALLSSSAGSVPFATEKEHSSATNAGNIEASRKLVRSDGNQYHDDEDNLSMASSVATTVRSTVSRITVPVAPKFVCNDRLSRRKEFYTKLEEKHRALEAEKIEVAARTKEEEEAAIKLLRKTTAYKANPVPSFYREGPPPKVELKKLPVTRAKSPNLSRRKSCSDAVKLSSPSPDEKGNNNCARIKRLSIGPIKPFTTTPPPPTTTTHRNKNPTFSRNPISTTPKTKDTTTASRNSSSRCSKEGIFTPPPPMKSKSFPGRTNTTTAVNRSKNHAKEAKETSPKVADTSMADSVAEITETMASPTATKEKIRTNTDTDTDVPIVEDDEAVEPKAVEQKTADIAVVET